MRMGMAGLLHQHPTNLAFMSDLRGSSSKRLYLSVNLNASAAIGFRYGTSPAAKLPPSHLHLRLPSCCSRSSSLPRAIRCSSASSSRSSPIIIRSRSQKQQEQEEEVMKLTYLEINSWAWEVGGVRILVDPILVGNLDFGAPWLFDGAKKHLKHLQVDDEVVAEADVLLITQSLDDHCHVRTLTQLCSRAPHLPVVATPNARPIIASLPSPSFTNVTYLEPGQSTRVAVAGKDDAAAAAAQPQVSVSILATPGPVLGPPWQRPENGYVVTDGRRRRSLYYEPHCVYDGSFLEKRQLQADVLITPVVKQLLPASFTLVSGQEDAVELARLLRPKYVVPMKNGDVDAKGLLATILSSQGTTESFKAMLSDVLPEAQVLEPTPGVPLQLQLLQQQIPSPLPPPAATA